MGRIKSSIRPERGCPDDQYVQSHYNLHFSYSCRNDRGSIHGLYSTTRPTIWQRLNAFKRTNYFGSSFSCSSCSFYSYHFFLSCRLLLIHRLMILIYPFFVLFLFLVPGLLLLLIVVCCPPFDRWLIPLDCTYGGPRMLQSVRRCFLCPSVLTEHINQRWLRMISNISFE